MNSQLQIVMHGHLHEGFISSFILSRTVLWDLCLIQNITVGNEKEMKEVGHIYQYLEGHML